MHCLEFAPAVKLDIMAPEGSSLPFHAQRQALLKSPILKPRQGLSAAYYPLPKSHSLCGPDSDPSSTLLRPCPSFPAFSTLPRPCSHYLV